MKYILSILALPLVFSWIALFWAHAVIYAAILPVARFLWTFNINASFTSLPRDYLHYGIPHPTVFKSYVHYHIAIHKLPALTEQDGMNIRTIAKANPILINKVLKPLVK